MAAQNTKSLPQKKGMSKKKKIITIEDPVEYKTPGLCQVQVNHKIGVTFAAGLRSIVRQDPDVILVGEMRDLETISTAITAAETGHLVFATLHTKGAANTIDRIIDVFPPAQQEQIRIQLSAVLHTIVSQQLLPDVNGGQVPAFEIMHVNNAIRGLIRDNKNHQIDNAIAAGGREGMVSMDRALADLVHGGKITRETALENTDRPEQLQRYLEK